MADSIPKRRKSVILNVEYNPQVIQFNEKEETDEELVKRVELENEAGAKKKVETEEKLKIRTALDNKLDMGGLLPLYSKWLTSQLQFVKDRSVRDVDTREPIYKSIYPQENGIPIISPSGKYWVKLRFMGEEKLVEIDDKMPVDKKDILLLPKPAQGFEIWPQLIVKAYLKLYSYKWQADNALYEPEV